VRSQWTLMTDYFSNNEGNSLCFIIAHLLLAWIIAHVIGLPPLVKPLAIVRRSKTTPVDLSTHLSCPQYSCLPLFEPCLLWPCLCLIKLCKWICTPLVLSTPLHNTRPHKDPVAFLKNPGQVWTHSTSCSICDKKVNLLSTSLNSVSCLIGYLLITLY